MRRDYPTPAEVNTLPEPLRHYIHDLETRCDHSGELRERASLRQQVETLELRCQRLEAQLAVFGVTPEG
jgi:hypothetical protein